MATQLGEAERLLQLSSERTNTAHMVFSLIDSDGDGLVDTEQLGVMLMSLALSQRASFDFDVEAAAFQMARHRGLRKVTFSDFVDVYNGLVDRTLLHAGMSALQTAANAHAADSSAAASSSLSTPFTPAAANMHPANPSIPITATTAARTTACADSPISTPVSPSSPKQVNGAYTTTEVLPFDDSISFTKAHSASQVASPTPPGRSPSRRAASGSAYLVSGAAVRAVNGLYIHSGESDGVYKYSYDRYTMLRRSLPGGEKRWYLAETASDERGDRAARVFYAFRSAAGTPPLEGSWSRAQDGVSPGPFVLPISVTHTPPPSVLAPHDTLEVGDYVRANWNGRGVFYPGEVLAVDAERSTADILYDDGDFESRVPRDRIHAVTIELTDAFHSYAVGDVVNADYRGHGAWEVGRIIAIDTRYRVFTIKYDVGLLEKHVPPSRVQPLGSGHIKSDYVRGDRVRANWQSCGTWCLGRIVAVNAEERTFDVQYDDGEVEPQVAAHSLQPVDESDAKAELACSAQLPFACSLVGKAQPANVSSRGSWYNT
uniref:EF-hand domain-containing protein n=1 Tax=Chrysotila carterae TaxID=13221 RepID=A0A7S4EYY5_CHRCT|mmetsp:Transcript_43262/g.94687  ORF Transcript_43262/g.94687 Transcript_43262/m.94687 type:complete len:544 (+) Transcript_43262:626-2257(+)